MFEAKYNTNILLKNGLNMFLVPIKLKTSKFSPYLILIGFLVLTKKITSNFCPYYNKVCLIIRKLLKKFKTSLEHYERFIYQNLIFFNMKRIKYEFFKTTKVKDKINKIWT